MDKNFKPDEEELLFEAIAPRLVVVIPVLNEIEHLENCLKSLQAGDPCLAKVQFLVVDGGSTDGTQELAQKLSEVSENLSWIKNPLKIQSAAMNLGAVEGEEGRDILVRCDAHAVYPENYVLLVAQSLLKRNVESLVVPMDAHGEGCFQKANAWVVDTPLGSGGSAHRGGTKSGFVDHGHHAAFQRPVFLKLGGYDEGFTHNEDAEYDARLRKSGGHIYLDTEIRIGYFPRENVKGLLRQYYNYGSGRAQNILKNGTTPRLRQLIPVVNVLGLCFALLLGMLYPVFFFIPAAYIFLLGMVSVFFVLRKKSLCGLWCGIALGAMHNAWGIGFLKRIFDHHRRKISQ